MHNNNDAHTKDKSPNWWMHDNNDAHKKINVLIDERWMLNNKSAQKNNKRPDQWTMDEA